MRTGTEFWLENMKERNHLGDISVDERIKLKLIFKTYDKRNGLTIHYMNYIFPHFLHKK
jgi:hypothetical protein